MERVDQEGLLMLCRLDEEALLALDGMSDGEHAAAEADDGEVADCDKSSSADMESDDRCGGRSWQQHR